MSNQDYVAALKSERSRPKTATFDALLAVVGDPDMAELIWIYLGEESLAMLDYPAPALNPHQKWWKPFAKKNTVRSLLLTESGREQVWQMLHDASAWLL